MVDCGVHCGLDVADDLKWRIALSLRQVLLVLAHHLTWLAKLTRLPWLLLHCGHVPLGVLLLLVGLLLGRLDLLHVVGLRLNMLHVTDALAYLELLLWAREVIVAAI